VEAMKPHQRMEVQLYAFLISTLDKGKWSLSPPRKEHLVCIEQRLYGLMAGNKCPFSD